MNSEYVRSAMGLRPTAGASSSGQTKVLLGTLFVAVFTFVSMLVVQYERRISLLQREILFLKSEPPTM